MAAVQAERRQTELGIPRDPGLPFNADFAVRMRTMNGFIRDASEKRHRATGDERAYLEEEVVPILNLEKGLLMGEGVVAQATGASAPFLTGTVREDGTVVFTIKDAMHPKGKFTALSHLPEIRVLGIIDTDADAQAYIERANEGPSKPFIEFPYPERQLSRRNGVRFEVPPWSLLNSIASYDRQVKDIKEALKEQGGNDLSAQDALEAALDARDRLILRLIKKRGEAWRQGVAFHGTMMKLPRFHNELTAVMPPLPDIYHDYSIPKVLVEFPQPHNREPLSIEVAINHLARLDHAYPLDILRIIGEPDGYYNVPPNHYFDRYIVELSRVRDALTKTKQESDSAEKRERIDKLTALENALLQRKDDIKEIMRANRTARALQKQQTAA